MADLTLGEIQQKIVTDAAGLDPTLQNTPASLVENVTSAGAIVIFQTQDLKNAMIANLSMAIPTQAGLNSFGGFVNLPLKDAIPTQAVVTVTGMSGVVLPIAFTVNNSSGSTPCSTKKRYTIATTGTVDIAVYAAANVTETIEPNSLTTITTTVQGVTAASNALAGVQGVPVESDGDYNYRLKTAMRAQNLGLPSLIRSYIAEVPGVILRLVNTIANTETGGIVVIAGGGDQAQVASAILQSVTSPSLLIYNVSTGNPTPTANRANQTIQYGNASNVWTVKYVIPSRVSFSLLIEWSVNVAVSTSAINMNLQTLVIDYCNEIQVGSALSLVSLSALVTDYIAGFCQRNQIVDVSIIATGGTAVSQLVLFNPWEYIQMDTTTVTVSS